MNSDLVEIRGQVEEGEDATFADKVKSFHRHVG